MKKFQSLVIVVNGEALASTEVIAKGMSSSHKNVLALVRKHINSLEEFGRVDFETQPFATRGGVQVREVALLNEQQAAILISLMRNTDKVIGFKVSLVKEFYRMKDALNQRTHNLRQQMQELIAHEVDSKVRASFGSHLMHARKKEKPYFEAEFERLETEIQPRLLN